MTPTGDADRTRPADPDRNDRTDTGTEHGTLDLDGPDPVLRFTRHLPHPPEKVWRALTEPEHLRNWFPTDIHGERRTGAPLTFAFRNGEGPELDGRMLAYDPHTLLELQWGDDELLRFELTPTDDGTATLLRFANTFKDLGTGARDAAGWHHCLHHLAADLDGHPSDEAIWEQVEPWYLEHFPAEATTVGPPDRG
jgi:uncharacterized protein YndB with AHSA1/START domain